VSGPPLVDLPRTARRLRRWLGLLAGGVPIAWLAGGAVRGSLELARLAELAGVAVLLALLIELVVVGGAALRGALRAGARGERLAAPDVTLLPPQVRARLRPRGAAAATAAQGLSPGGGAAR